MAHLRKTNHHLAKVNGHLAKCPDLVPCECPVGLASSYLVSGQFFTTVGGVETRCDFAVTKSGSGESCDWEDGGEITDPDCGGLTIDWIILETDPAIFDPLGTGSGCAAWEIATNLGFDNLSLKTTGSSPVGSYPDLGTVGGTGIRNLTVS